MKKLLILAAALGLVFALASVSMAMEETAPPPATGETDAPLTPPKDLGKVVKEKEVLDNSPPMSNIETVPKNHGTSGGGTNSRLKK